MENDYLMEGFVDKGLWIIFENCESICVPIEKVECIRFDGLKKTKSWSPEHGWKESDECEGLYIHIKDISVQHKLRLKKYFDITQVHFDGLSVALDWKGDYENDKQAIHEWDNSTVITVSEDNLEEDD